MPIKALTPNAMIGTNNINVMSSAVMIGVVSSCTRSRSGPFVGAVEFVTGDSEGSAEGS